MLAPLVAIICNMPLESKILFHTNTLFLKISMLKKILFSVILKLFPTDKICREFLCSTSNYLSLAPQAEPQADGFLAGLSPAPQAEPQADGFLAGLSPAPQAEPQADGFSAGLSPTPQAEPQADGADNIVFQPFKLKSAIILYLLIEFETYHFVSYLYFILKQK